MLKAWPKSIITLITFITLCTCIDPFSPKLKGYKSILVVEGLITNENTSYTVKLSSTSQDQNESHVMISDATVSITDDDKNITFLGNIGCGIYKTDSLQFIGTIGKTYTLHIITNDGDEYRSEQCLMYSVPDIDSIYFERDQELVNNGTENQEGLRIYLDSNDSDNNQYYRWSFEETWKFIIPSPKRFDYIDMNTIVPLAEVKRYCWKKSKSDEVIIHYVNPGQNDGIKKKSIFFIASDKSDRLMSEYNILVKQYSISKNEYDFWNNLKRVNDSGADIFASQPYPVISNLREVNNPDERVLGYFQVSAVKQKRKLISFNDIVKMHLPFYHSDQCERIEKSPGEYSNPFGPPVTFDDLYAMFCITSKYTFIEPMYSPETTKLDKLVFAKPECTNCGLTGTMTKPDFWIDLN
jgi:Domain of unknown function (DUF4249)